MAHIIAEIVRRYLRGRVSESKIFRPVDEVTVFRKARRAILKGTPPADLPIERAVKFDLIPNLKSAKALGIELPTALLIRANGTIE
jgi:ABC transporter substrate binding protein